MELYFNIETEYNGGSIFLTVLLYIIVAVLFIEAVLTFEF